MTQRGGESIHMVFYHDWQAPGKPGDIGHSYPVL